jgi:hypothetical protein
MFVREEQSLNAFCPMLSILDDNLILLRLEQSANKLFSILKRLAARLRSTSYIDEHPENAEAPNSLKVLGNYNLLLNILEHPEKAPWPIRQIFAGISAFSESERLLLITDPP